MNFHVPLMKSFDIDTYEDFELVKKSLRINYEKKIILIGCSGVLGKYFLKRTQKNFKIFSSSRLRREEKFKIR